MARINGGIIGPDNIPTGPLGTASGVWRLQDATKYQGEGLWPIVTGITYPVANSLRFNSGSSDYLSRTPAGTSSGTITTHSLWFKRSDFASDFLYINFENGTNYGYIGFDSDSLDIRSSPGYVYVTTQKLRDPSAWYHLVVAVDNSLGTASDRVKIYLNGSRVTSFSTQTDPSSGGVNNLSVDNTASNLMNVGGYSGGNYFGGYIAEFNFIDGQALDPTDFGEFDEDSGIWKPIPYAGTYGTNGFYLEFQDSGALGTDTSGNGNNFTVNNLTSIDQTTDTPTNNFATGNALACPNVGTLSEGNLQIVGNTTLNYYGFVSSTIGMSSGKWYAEFKKGTSGTNSCDIGITPNPMSNGSTGNDWLGSSTIAGSYSYDGNNGNIVTNGSGSAYGSSYTTGDIVSVALDLTNSKLYVAKNGTWQNSADPVAGSGGYSITAVSSTASGVYFFAFGDNAGTSGTGYATVQANFGSPIYSANSYTDGAGYGNFSYAVPSGYYALCTKNLAEFG